MLEHNTLTSVLTKIRFRLWARQLPKVITQTTFDPAGVRFEAASPTELYRIVHHGYEPRYLHHMLGELRSDDVLWDIGANIGLVSLHAASRCRAAVAFEPDPGFFARLQRNLGLNAASNVKAFPIAIGEHDGRVTLFTDGADGNSPSLVHQRQERGSVEVQARTLDSMIRESAFPRPTVLKLDIEGAEILALRGATDLLRGHQAPRALFIEVHDSFLPEFESSADEVLAILCAAGYTTALYEEKRWGEQQLILTR